MKHISKEVLDAAILKGPSGSHWNVKLCRKEGGLFLQDGWQQFMKDHSLGNHEFLVFRYDGNMHFNVQIFYESGLEKVDPDQDATTVKRIQGRPTKNTVIPLDLHQSPCKHGAVQRFPCHKWKKPMKPEKGKGAQKKIRAKAMALTIPEADPQLKKSGKKDTKRKINKKFLESDSQRKIKTEGIDLPIQETDMHAICCSSRRHPPTEDERARVWETVESFTSGFPYFMCCLKEFNVHKMFLLPIPKFFSQSHLPDRLKTKICLRNPEGNGWIVNVIPVRGSHSFSGGWRDFVLWNKLKEGDICIFELLDEKDMQVHIFRSVK